MADSELKSESLRSSGLMDDSVALLEAEPVSRLHSFAVFRPHSGHEAVRVTGELQTGLLLGLDGDRTLGLDTTAGHRTRTVPPVTSQPWTSPSGINTVVNCSLSTIIMISFVALTHSTP